MSKPKQHGSQSAPNLPLSSDGASAASDGVSTSKRKPRRVTFGTPFIRERFSAPVDWLREVRAMALRDLTDGGSGRYAVFRDGANFYFERWKGEREYAWEHQAKLPVEERRAA